jgi:hypothetical protein
MLAQVHQIYFLKRTLEYFAVSIRLKVNYQRSNPIPHKYSEHKVLDFTDSLDCQMGCGLEGVNRRLKTTTKLACKNVKLN